MNFYCLGELYAEEYSNYFINFMNLNFYYIINIFLIKLLNIKFIVEMNY